MKCYRLPKSTGYIAALLWLLSVAVSNCIAAPILRLDANEAPPFFAKALPLDGMAGEIIHTIAKAAGLQADIQFKPLNRMIQNDRNNDLGNPKFFMRNQNFSAIIPVGVYHVSVFHYLPNHRHRPNIRSLSDLKGYKVGLLKGTLVDRGVFQNSGISIEESYSQESLFKKLQKGRIDLVIAVDLIGKSIISRLFPFDKDEFGSDLIAKSASPIAILLAEELPDGKRTGSKLMRALQKIRSNGEYEAILKKYYGETIPEDYYQQLDRFSYLYHEKAE